MSWARSMVRVINSFVSLLVSLLLIFAGLYAGFALWDNNQIYSAAQDVQIKMQEIKPVIEEGEEGPSFSELLAINPDVRAWVTMNGTHIDFPVLQGETNLSYINTDVYGKFALAGSIFLDCRNLGDFSENYNLTYGHHMAGGNMYGDLDLYKDKKFFDENTTGVLMTTNGVYDLKVVALLMVSASEDRIFDVTQNQDTDDVITYIMKNDMPKVGDEVKFFVLSTCASEFTDARTILITTMSEHR